MEALFILAVIGLVLLLTSAINSSSDSNENTRNNSRSSNYNRSVHTIKQEEIDARAKQQRQAEYAYKQREIAAKAEQDRQAQLKLTEQLERQRQAEVRAKAEQQRRLLEQTERLKQAARAEEKRQEEARAEQRRQVELRAEQQRQAAVREEQQRQAAERVELELCERNTDYFSDIENSYNNNPHGYSLTTIRNLSYDCGVFHELESGVALLNTPQQLIQYIYSYGKMHKAKLHQSFEALVNSREFDLRGQSIEIIDYGCGQGIGTVGLIDCLKSYPSFRYTINKVRLIEPSLLALKRASLHVRYSLQSARQPQVVHSINKGLDDITTNDLACDDFAVKFHIFSNILDISSINLQNLCGKIADTFEGVNYFVCVSPKIFADGSHPRNQRLVRFMEYFQNTYETTEISSRTCDINTWKRFERVFKVDFNELITNTNINATLVDEPDDLPF
jgi:hypothetical protein